MRAEDDQKFLLYWGIVRNGFIYMQMLLILMEMTIDRALFVYLSLKYEAKKVNRVTNLVFLFNILVSIVTVLAFVFTQTSRLQSIETTTLYFWPIMDGLVLLTFIASYSFIVHTVGRRSKNLFGAESTRYKNRMKRATLAPKLIVLSFVIFWISVDVILIIFHQTNRTLPNWSEPLLELSICLYFTTDALFYIFFSQSIKNTMKRKFLGRKITYTSTYRWTNNHQRQSTVSGIDDSLTNRKISSQNLTLKPTESGENNLPEGADTKL